MYQDLLQSSARPFRATPDQKFYFAHESMETAKSTAARAVQRAEGPVLVLGGVGLGKSLLGELIASELGQQYDLVRLSAARLCSRRALLQNILFELDLPYQGLSEGELRISLMDRLQPKPEYAQDGILVIVDEAHTLPVKLLEELRLITNFSRNGQPRVRLVLIGGMQLEETFASPQLESFNQRLAARCYLSPMTREQTHAYVRHQFAIAGYQADQMISEEGYQAVCAASEGVPRLINQVMDHALVLAVSSDRFPITGQVIEEAWADLQQLPAPWQTTADLQADTATSTIEYGQLGDDESDFSSQDIEAVEELDSTTPAETGEEDPLSFGEEKMDDPDSQDDSRGQADASSTFETSPRENPIEAGSEDTAPSQNFFAAFEIPANQAIDDELDGRSTGIADAVSVDSLEKPEVVIIDVEDRFGAGRHDIGFQHLEENQVLPTDSFFKDRPTDEKLIGLVDEQRQYDEMGVWENDPPLSNQVISESSESSKTADTSEPKDAVEDADRQPAQSAREDIDQDVVPADTQTDGDKANSDTEQIECEFASTHDLTRQLTSAALFGEDFDEEISLNPAALERNSIQVATEDGTGWNRSELMAIDNELAAAEAASDGIEDVTAPSDSALFIEDASLCDDPSTTEVTIEASDGAQSDIEERSDAIYTVGIGDLPESIDLERGLSLDISTGVAANMSSPEEKPSGGAMADDHDDRGSAEAVAASLEGVESLTDMAIAEEREDAANPSPVEAKLEASREHAILVADHLARIQEFADHMAAASTGDATVECVLRDGYPLTDGFENRDSELLETASAWTIDASRSDAAQEATLHAEIEDLVSQLNFSAFAVEPFSVEQIPIESESEGRSVASDRDFERYDSEAQETEPAMRFFSEETSLYDDDRDLLVIEEDLAKLTTEQQNASENKTTRTAPYAQLFSKLRK